MPCFLLWRGSRCPHGPAVPECLELEVMGWQCGLPGRLPGPSHLASVLSPVLPSWFPCCPVLGDHLWSIGSVIWPRETVTLKSHFLDPLPGQACQGLPSHRRKRPKAGARAGKSLLPWLLPSGRTLTLWQTPRKTRLSPAAPVLGPLFIFLRHF